MFRFSELQQFGGEGEFSQDSSLTAALADFLETLSGTADYGPPFFVSGTLSDFLETFSGTGVNEGIYVGIAPRFSEQQRFGGLIGEEFVLSAALTDHLESVSGTAEYVAPPLPVNPEFVYWTAPTFEVGGAPITYPLTYELGLVSGETTTQIATLVDEAFGDVERRAPLDIHWFAAGETTVAVRARSTVNPSEVSEWSNQTSFEAVISRATADADDFLETFSGTATFVGVPEFNISADLGDYLEAFSGTATAEQPARSATGGYTDFLEAFSGQIERPPGRTVSGSYDDALEGFSGAAVVSSQYIAGWCRDTPLVDAPTVRFGHLVARPTVLDCEFTARTNQDQAA